jgi:hypothetical protein
VAQMASYTVTVKVEPHCDVVLNEFLNMLFIVFLKFLEVESHIFCARPFNWSFILIGQPIFLLISGL